MARAQVLWSKGTEEVDRDYAKINKAMLQFVDGNLYLFHSTLSLDTTCI